MTKKTGDGPAESKGTPADHNSPGEAGVADRAGSNADSQTSARPTAVVGIGASAGGLEALEELLLSMPADTGLAFAVVLHQHRGYKSLLSDLLSKKTAMPVSRIAHSVRLQPNHVYICQPGEYLAVLNGTLQIVQPIDGQSEPLQIDYFFKSLAQDLGERAIGIILSGTGTDGSLGVKAIKAGSGMVMAQKPQTAKYAGMPASAVATGQVDYILPPREMPEQLVSYVNSPYLDSKARSHKAPAIPQEPLQQIFIILRDHTGNDFSAYKTNTTARRIARRMNLHQIENYDEYVRYLQENPIEIDALFKELLINVTDFFRDKDAWKALSRQLESLVANHSADEPLRAWVPGCATGEEPFSLAITLSETMRKRGRKHEVQIFGTDLDETSIAIARAGRYPSGIAGEVPQEIIERYFSREAGTYRINNDIREMVVFAPHNLIKNPPFTRLDIVSCRNLLIYLNSELQKSLIPLFHYSLKPGGLLFLGSSETVGNFDELFIPVDARWKIFRRSSVETRIQPLPQWSRLTASPSQSKSATPGVKRLSTVALIERMLLERYTPSSIVVNSRGDIHYIHGHTGAYLEPSQGEPRNNIREMAREGLKMALVSALRECTEKKIDVVHKGLAIKLNGGSKYTDLTVSFLHHPEALRGLLLVVLEPAKFTSDEMPDEIADADKDTAAAEGLRNKQNQGGAAPRVTQLERELEYLNQSYRTIVEEMEIASEEFKSTNEELQSTNEELQSTNEELETSKEEMQSLNEELNNVNMELQSKLYELSRVNDDMVNLLNSTDIAAIFLDRELRIQRYTDQVKELVMIRPADIGRPISELAFNLDIANLTADCNQVLATLVFKELDVGKGTDDHTHYLLRIIPYRTAKNVIDGLVLTFINVWKLRQHGATVELDAEYFESIVDTVHQPLIVLNRQLQVLSANKTFYSVFNTTQRQTQHASIFELFDRQLNSPQVHVLLSELLSKNTSFEAHQVAIDIAGTGHRVFLLNGRRLERRSGSDVRILLAMEDITERLHHSGATER